MTEAGASVCLILATALTGLQQTIALNFAKKVIVNLFMELKANVI